MTWQDSLEGSSPRVAGVEDTPLRVVAGPDTGKTFSLMKRVQRLLEENVLPRRILVVTFTRTAAADRMQELGRPGVPRSDLITACILFPAVVKG